MTKRREIRIPAYPVLSLSSFRSSADAEERPTEHIACDRTPLNLTSGRMALAHILEEIGVDHNSKVMLPAFHCVSMVLPITSLGATPVFYSVNRDLTPDMQSILAKCSPDVRCIVFVHYFGFPRISDAVLQLANERSIVAVEDCAHVLFGSHKGKSLGTFGDYAICSPWKFLPVFDGGWALSRSQEFSDDTLSPGGVRFELKAAVNLLEGSVQAGRLGVLGRLLRVSLSLKDLFLNFAKRSGFVNTAGAGPASAVGGAEFEERWLNVRMSWISRFVLRHVSYSRIVRIRRTYFERLIRAFSEHDGCRPIFGELPRGVVPYVFPLYVDEGEKVYKRIRQAGLPVFRWDDIPDGICQTASAYQYSLIQLPIHQELMEHELEEIVNGVKEAIDYVAASNGHGEQDVR